MDKEPKFHALIDQFKSRSALIFCEEEIANMKIRVKCAWCHLCMGTKAAESRIAEPLLVSHSICPACRKQLTADTNLALRKIKQSDRVSA